MSAAVKNSGVFLREGEPSAIGVFISIPYESTVEFLKLFFV